MLNTIQVGNNIDILKTIPDNSIDSIVTDPPYGLGKEPNAIEVLTSWVTNGFHEIKGKGFMGKEWDAFVPQPIFWKECIRVLKPGGYLLSFAGTRTYDWIVMGLRISWFEICDQIAWVYGSGFPKSHDVAKAIEGQLVYGSSNTQAFNKLDGDEIDTKLGFTKNQHEQGARPNDYTDRHKSKTNIKYTTDQAKQWQGWGTALKPALAPIVVARKKLEGTVAENVLKYGVGGINIDECRVGEEERTQFSGKASNGNVYFEYNQDNAHYETVNGRFPANFIHDNSEEVVDLLQESARFFYTPKASQKERNKGLDEFEETTDKSKGNGRDRVCGYCGASQLKPQDCKCEQKSWITKTKKNIHPTVKPIELMRYLVKLVTPKGATCIDPFMGSGTTAIACKLESINYIGCELNEEYAKIAESRINDYFRELTIFDTEELEKEEKKKQETIEQITLEI